MSGGASRPMTSARRNVSPTGFVTLGSCWMCVGAVAEGHEENQLLLIYRFPPEIIHHAIWLYLRFTLRFRDVEDCSRAWDCGLLGDRAALGEPLRTDDRGRPAKASPEASSDVASGRGLSENRRPNGLPLAGRRRRGRGPRCAGPVEAQQARRAETDAQAPEEACLRS